LREYFNGDSRDDNKILFIIFQVALCHPRIASYDDRGCARDGGGPCIVFRKRHRPFRKAEKPWPAGVPVSS